MLRWVRVPSSVPHLHRSYAALRLPCRFSTPPVCPRSCLTRWTSVFSVPLHASIAGPAAGPLAADGASERVTGSPLPGSTYGTVRGLPGYRVVLFGRAAVDHPARLPSTCLSAAGSAAFRDRDTLSTRDLRISGLLSCGPPARLTTLQPCPRGRRLQVWLPACWLGFDWVGIAPTGRLIRVLVYIPTSSPTGIAWLLPRSAVLFRQTCRNMPGFTDTLTCPVNASIDTKCGCSRSATPVHLQPRHINGY